MARRALSAGALVLSMTGLSSAGKQRPLAMEIKTTLSHSSPVCAGKVDSPARLRELSECDTWEGDLVISGLLSEYLAYSSESSDRRSLALNLNGVDGSLLVQDMPFPLEFSASLLSSVNGELQFSNMADLEMPRFDVLKSVNDIKFETVTFAPPAAFDSASFGNPSLVRSFNFTSTNVAEIDTTFDDGLNSIGSQLTNASFTALNNPQLKRISVPGYSGADPMAIDIRGNSAQPTVEFPNIQSCSLNLQEIANFSAPALQTIKARPMTAATVSSTAPSTGPSSAGKTPPRVSKRQASSEDTSNLITGNSISELELRELQTIEVNLEISDNENLRSIAFPQLANIAARLDIDADIDT